MIEKYSHCKSSDTIDDTKLDCSSDTDISRETDSGSEYAYSSSEENSSNVSSLADTWKENYWRVYSRCYVQRRSGNV